MYLSAERLAVANEAVRETFANTCIAWQAIPHWDTGDPAQTRVPDGDITTMGFVPIVGAEPVDFDATLAEAIAPTPDGLLARVIKYTGDLANNVDKTVLPKLYEAGKKPLDPPDPKAPNKPVELKTTGPQGLLDGLIDARASVENTGYRAASCLIANTAGLKALSKLEGGYPVIEALLSAANINSLYRSDLLDDDKIKVRLLVIGRRQRIAHQGAAEATPGEEPVDLAVSVCPDLDVIGADINGKMALTVRIRYAPRVKDANGLVSLEGIPTVEP